MPPTLGRQYPPNWEGYPPHMSARDYQLWRRFIHQHQPPFARIYFDVALGHGAPGPAQPDARAALAWRRVTSFRADAIGENLEGWTIIELRDGAGPGAIGALTVYRHLWTDDPPDTRHVAAWLVTNNIHPDLLTLLPALDITLYLVPGD